MPRVAVVPPCGLTTVACPSVRPLQVILVPVVGSAVIAVGSEKLIGPNSSYTPTILAPLKEFPLAV